MKYCSNCGAEINENAVVCVKCGAAVQNANNSLQKSNSNSTGFAKSSMILGIVAIIFGAISLVLALCVNYYLTGTFEGRLERYATDFATTKIGLYILLIPVPAILSIIGFLLGLFNKNKSNSKTVGIVSNAITIVICIIEIIMISGL